jgi:hypothetical protein
VRGRAGWGLGPWLRAVQRTDAERRAAVDARYREEVGAAMARGWTETAAAIERERAQWVAEGAPL